MARFVSMKLVALVVIAVVLVVSMAGDASAQDFGGYVQNGGPIQFPPSPMLEDMNNVVIGGSGFGFLPPRAGGYNNFGSVGGYRGGSPLGGGYQGGNSLGSGGYRTGSTVGVGYRPGSPVGGGLGAYRASGSSHFGGFGGYGFRGGAFPSATHGGLPSYVNYVNHG